MSGILETATSFMDRRQLASMWLPVLAFVTGLAAILISATGWDRTRSWWTGLGGAGQGALVIALLLATVLAGQALSAGRVRLLQLYEGHWPRAAGLVWFRYQMSVRHRRLQRDRTAERPDL